MVKKPGAHADFLGTAHEDLQKLKDAPEASEALLQASKDLFEALEAGNRVTGVEDQARLNAVAAKNLLVEAQTGPHAKSDHVTVIAATMQSLNSVLNREDDKQTQGNLTKLYNIIGRFKTQDMTLRKFDGTELRLASRNKLYAMGIRSQEQIEAIRKDGSGESVKIIGELFDKYLNRSGMQRLLGTKESSKKPEDGESEHTEEEELQLDTLRNDILEKLDNHFDVIKIDIGKTCAGSCDLTKIDKDSKYYEAMLRQAYKGFVEKENIRHPEEVASHFDAFHSSNDYTWFIRQFERDAKRMGEHLSETSGDGIVRSDKVEVRSSGDEVLVEMNPDNFVGQAGKHRILHKEASFLGDDFDVRLQKTGGGETTITPRKTNGGKTVTLHIPKSELSDVEKVTIHTPELQPEIEYKGDSNVTMTATKERESREIVINKDKINEMLKVGSPEEQTLKMPVITSPVEGTELTTNSLKLEGTTENEGGEIYITLSQDGTDKGPVKVTVSGDVWEREIKDLTRLGLTNGPIQVKVEHKVGDKKTEPVRRNYVLNISTTPLETPEIKEINPSSAKKENVDPGVDVEHEFLVKGTPGEEFDVITTNGEYQDSTGSWVDHGRVTVPALGMLKIKVRIKSASTELTESEMSLNVGGKEAPFTVKTKKEVVNVMPNDFPFPPQNNVALSTPITSDPVVITGITSPQPVSIVVGEYSINGGPWTSTVGRINAGDVLQARVISSTAHSDTTTAAVTVGGKTSMFKVKTLDAPTPAPDVLDPFSFSAKDKVPLGHPIVSDQVIISGITTPKEVRIAGGEYRINGGAWTNALGIVNNGDLVEVQVISSTNYNTPTTATINIGGKPERFVVTTDVAPVPTSPETPDDFNFTPRTGQALSTQVVSETIPLSGFTTALPITIAGGGEYRINGGAWTNTVGTVNSGNLLEVRVTSSANHDETVSTTVNVGGRIKTFSVTTLTAPAPIAPEMPDDFNFTPRTGQLLSSRVESTPPIPLGGFTRPVPIIIGGGEYRINGGAWTDTAGTVDAGDLLEVRVRSSATHDDTTHATVNVGGRTKTFSVTTLTAPGHVSLDMDSFSIDEKDNAPLNQHVNRAGRRMTIRSGGPAPISIVGGEYRINGGPRTAVAGTVNNGDLVEFRVRSSNLHNTSTTAEVTIGHETKQLKATTETARGRLSITSPAHGAVFQEGNPVSFTGISSNPGSRVEVFQKRFGLFERTHQQCIVDGTGSWKYNVDGLKSRNYTFYFQETFPDGRKGAIEEITIKVNKNPVAAGSSPATTPGTTPTTTPAAPTTSTTTDGKKKGFFGKLKDFFNGTVGGDYFIKDKKGTTSEGSGDSGSSSGSSKSGKGFRAGLVDFFNGTVGGDYVAPHLNKAGKSVKKWVDDYPGGDAVFKKGGGK